VPSFIEGLLDQLLPNFSSPLINIGCDEVYDIAYGRSKNEVAKRGRGAVYFDFVRKIARMCKDRKRTPMFWADMLESHADLLAMVPEDMISLVWGYEPSHDFEGILRRLALANRQAWVCPGTSSWLSHFGRTSERLGNIKAAVQQGLTHNAAGVLTCDWGDQGHRQQPSISMLGMALGADASWNPRAVDTHSLAAASLHALHDRSLQAASWMATLGDIDLPLRKTCLGLSRPDQTGQLQNASALFVDSQLPLTAGKDVGDLSLWRSVASSLATQRVPTGLAPRLHDELSHSLDCARFAATRALARRFPAGLTRAGAKVLLDQLDIVMHNHRRLWHVSSRTGGLDNSLSHYQRSLKELQAITG
jgi:hexosaminidase